MHEVNIFCAQRWDLDNRSSNNKELRRRREETDHSAKFEQQSKDRLEIEIKT